MPEYILCTDPSGFEDQLEATIYEVIDMQNNSVLITNEAGQDRWYGLCKFSFGF